MAEETKLYVLTKGTHKATVRGQKITYKAGESVPLTTSQYQSFKDRFQPKAAVIAKENAEALLQNEDAEAAQIASAAEDAAKQAAEDAAKVQQENEAKAKDEAETQAVIDTKAKAQLEAKAKAEAEAAAAKAKAPTTPTPAK